jgi:hypothetical protein
MAAEKLIQLSEISVLLSSALGQEKSDELVLSAARDLGFASASESGYASDEVRAIFEKLSRIDGLVGVVSRFAVSRGDVDRLAARAPISEKKVAVKRPKASATELIPLLAPAIGVEKAKEAIDSATTRLGLDANALAPEDAVAVLDLLAKSEGIVGVVARFAKARFLLSGS